MIDIANVNKQVDNFFDEIDPRNKTMLVNLVLTCFTARKYDKKVSDGVAKHNKASNEAGRYNKCLIDIEQYIKPIKQIHGEMRTHHYHLTLPFMDNGSRILAVSNFEEYCEGMNEYIEKVDRLVAAFIASYPQAKEEAKQFLGAMYREEDYPHEEQIKSKFSAEFYISPLPDVDDFRIQLPEHVRQQAEDKIKGALDDAMRDVWQRFEGKVRDIAEKLPAFDRGDIRTFRRSLITNLAELLDVMPGLNLYDDPQLAELVEESRSLIKANSDTLKDDDTLRRQVAQQANDILNKINFQNMAG